MRIAISDQVAVDGLAYYLFSNEIGAAFFYRLSQERLVRDRIFLLVMNQLVSDYCRNFFDRLENLLEPSVELVSGSVARPTIPLGADQQRPVRSSAARIHASYKEIYIRKNGARVQSLQTLKTCAY